METRLDERRALQRRHLIYYSQVLDSKTGEPLGRLADLTVAGLMLVGEEEIELGLEFVLEIELPRMMRARSVLKVIGQSMWSGPDVNPDLRATGFQFVNLGIPDMRIIEELIREYGFQD